jgi:hypothetical protein
VPFGWGGYYEPYRFTTSQALFAVAACAVYISKPNAVALHIALDGVADFFNGASTFVSENLVSALVVLICAAEPRVGDLDEDFIGSQLPGGGGLVDLALLGAFVYCE